MILLHLTFEDFLFSKLISFNKFNIAITFSTYLVVSYSFKDTHLPPPICVDNNTCPI